METEIWKDVIGYEGFYQVSNLGNIKSLGRTTIGAHGSTLHFKERILSPASNRGYCHILLYGNEGVKKRWHTTSHKIVAMAFLPNPYNKKQINHKNGIKHDNRVENLEWCTDKENKRHAIVTGLKIMPSGEKCPASKLKKDDVIAIRAMYGDLSAKELAKKFNISRRNISMIVNHKSWVNI